MISRKCIERCNVTESVPFNSDEVCVVARNIHNNGAEACFNPPQKRGTYFQSFVLSILTNYKMYKVTNILNRNFYSFIS